MTCPDAQPQTRETLVETVRAALDRLRGILRVHVLPADDALSVLAARLETAERERDEAQEAWDSVARALESGEGDE